MKTQFFIHFQDEKLELLEGRTYTIGRSTQNDICLIHSTVSRKHAQLFWDVDGFTLQDRNSRNGIRVKNHKISSFKLKNNEHIYFGDALLKFSLIVPETENSNIIDTNTKIINERFDHIIKNAAGSTLGEKVIELKEMFTQKKDELKNLANKDILTGLFNRRYFEQKTDEEITRAIRYQRNLSFIMADIDHFKQFNDTYGHQKGDEVLAFVANILKTSSRTQDIVFRYGGEEMCILLPETSLEKAILVAEKVKGELENQSRQQLKLNVTISMGVSELNQNIQNSNRLLKAADEALYRAKEQGRNCVIASND